MSRSSYSSDLHGELSAERLGIMPALSIQIRLSAPELLLTTACQWSESLSFEAHSPAQHALQDLLRCCSSAALQRSQSVCYPEQ